MSLSVKYYPGDDFLDILTGRSAVDSSTVFAGSTPVNEIPMDSDDLYSGLVVDFASEMDDDVEVAGFELMGAAIYLAPFFKLKPRVLKPFRSMAKIPAFMVSYDSDSDTLTIRADRRVKGTLQVTQDLVAYLGADEWDQVLGFSLRRASWYLASDFVRYEP